RARRAARCRASDRRSPRRFAPRSRPSSTPRTDRDCRSRSGERCAAPGDYTARVFPTIPPPPQRLLVFARLPERGAVKTRLARDLGDDRALEIYEAMLRDLLASIGTATEETEIEVLWAPTPIAGGDTLRRAFGDRSLA